MRRLERELDQLDSFEEDQNLSQDRRLAGEDHLRMEVKVACTSLSRPCPAHKVEAGSPQSPSG